SMRQPHLPDFEGVPKMLTKYQPGLRTIAPPFSKSARIDSRLMIVVAFSKPDGLVPARSSDLAVSFCWTDICSKRRPLRVGFLSLSCKGTKFQFVLSLSSKANSALLF